MAILVTLEYALEYDVKVFYEMFLINYNVTRNDE